MIVDNNCASIDTNELTRRLEQLVLRERQSLVEFLRHLAEFDRRSTYLQLGFPSLFAFCREHLRLAKGTAYRRSLAARLISRYPLILEYVADGSLGIAGLCHLKDVITLENHRAVLDSAAGLDEDEIRVLAASLNPKCDVTDSVRRVDPERVFAVLPAEEETPAPKFVAVPRIVLNEIEPRNSERYAVRMSVGKEFLDEFEQVKDALSHVVPDGKMEDVIRECFRMALSMCERRKIGAKRTEPTTPAPAAAPNGSTVEPNVEPVTKPTRYIPTTTRRAVFERDRGRCAFVGANGRRCGSTHLIQFHHQLPFGREGTSSVENLALYCSAHNAYQARLDYGDEHMKQFVGTESG
jgi:hypothetical protein